MITFLLLRVCHLFLLQFMYCWLLGFQRVDKTVGRKNVIISTHVCLARFKTMFTPYKHFVLKYAD